MFYVKSVLKSEIFTGYIFICLYFCGCELKQLRFIYVKSNNRTIKIYLCMMEKFSYGNVRRFVSGSYRTACMNGFHDEKYSVGHLLMLVISEVGEAVEADRKGVRYKECYGDKELSSQVDDVQYAVWFSHSVKDTLEDELADVAIRLFDFCGANGLRFSRQDFEYYDEMMDEFSSQMSGKDFADRCFVLCGLVTMCDDAEVQGDVCGLRACIACALCFLWCMCADMGIDICRHIRWKMRYNRSRGYLHGKRY